MSESVPATGEDLDTVDAWRLVGFPGVLSEASYLIARNAAQYRLIVDVLLDQQQHSLTGVSRSELANLVRQRVIELSGDASILDDAFDLDARMSALVEWLVVDRWQDRAVRDEDFLRNRDRFQLTVTAARLHRAVRALGVDESAAVAATLAPAVLRAQLEAMRVGIASDPEAVGNAWAVVTTTIDGMAAAAAGWQAQLAGALAGTPDARKLDVLTDTLRRYVDMWGAGVDVHSGAISTDVHVLQAAEEGKWRAVALHVVGADATDDQVSEASASYLQTLRTVIAWFDGSQSQARRLRRQVRDTIAPLVRGQRTVAAVGGHVSRRVELMTLAGRLERADNDEQAWGIWCRATGLFSARHLSGLAPPIAGSAGNVSFWEAAPVRVEARLRKLGPRATTGAPARMTDRSAGRAAARRRAAAEREAAARTRAALLARSGQRLAEWSEVAPPELDQLIVILAALAAAPADSAGDRVTTTGDGLWHVRSELLGPGSVTVGATSGALVCPDLTLTISLPGMSAAGAP